MERLRDGHMRTRSIRVADRQGALNTERKIERLKVTVSTVFYLKSCVKCEYNFFLLHRQFNSCM